MIGLRFEHRSGRVIALGRTTLAFVFLATLIFDTEAWSTSPETSAALLLSYAGFAVFVLAAGWNDWWRESRIAPTAHLVDLAFYATLTFLTGGYASPFFTFFVFIVLASAMRWKLRQALATSLIVAIIFLAAASVSMIADTSARLEATRFVIRGASILVLSGMILWFGVHRYGAMRQRIGDRLLTNVVSSEPPAREALLLAAAHLEAERAVFAWSEIDEPWVQLLTFTGGRIEERRAGPDAYPELLENLPLREPFLFDVERKRILYESRGKLKLQTLPGTVDARFAADHGLSTGIAIPVNSSGHEGVMIAGEIAGLAPDFLPIAARVSEQVSAAFERSELIASSRQATGAQARVNLARDIHDGAIQFLAGMALKVRALRGADSGIAAEKLDEIERELLQQQSEARKMIENLRRPVRASTEIDLTDHLAALAKRLHAQWGIQIDVSGDGLPMSMTSLFQHQLEHIVREAVSNAVRHGGARTVHLSLAREGRWLRLEAVDDGDGFSFRGVRTDDELWQEKLGPRSVHERIRSLGGSLAIAASPSGSTLSMRLPVENR
jgi:signal transduction histidine kinase